MNKKEYKSKMPLEERARRRAAIGAAASEKVAKSEQLNFRIEANAIRELQHLAQDRQLPVSTMIHDWVIERLNQERFGSVENTGKAWRLLSEIHGKLHGFCNTTKARNVRA